MESGEGTAIGKTCVVDSKGDWWALLLVSCKCQESGATCCLACSCCQVQAVWGKWGKLILLGQHDPGALACWEVGRPDG